MFLSMTDNEVQNLSFFLSSHLVAVIVLLSMEEGKKLFK